MEPLTVILVLGSLLCVWSLLRCMGNERERNFEELEARLAAEAEAALNAAPPAQNAEVRARRAA